MPKVTIEISDKVNSNGKPSVSFSSTFDGCGYPDDAPPTDATMAAYAFRMMAERGILEPIIMMFRVHLIMENMVSNGEYVRENDSDTFNNVHAYMLLQEMGIIDLLKPIIKDVRDFRKLKDPLAETDTVAEGHSD